MKVFLSVIVILTFIKTQSQDINIQTEYCKVINKQDFTGSNENLNGNYINYVLEINNKSNDTLIMPSLGILDTWSNDFINSLFLENINEPYFTIKIDEFYDNTSTEDIEENIDIEEVLVDYHKTSVVINLSDGLTKIPPKAKKSIYILKKIQGSIPKFVQIRAVYNTCNLNKKNAEKNYKNTLNNFKQREKKHRKEIQKIEKQLTKYTIKSINGSTTTYTHKFDKNDKKNEREFKQILKKKSELEEGFNYYSRDQKDKTEYLKSLIQISPIKLTHKKRIQVVN
ncbi:hypothetical protein [Aquimarina algicola]|uniref:Uncharacterized protein n=1 Tax=Aquimarina algicola TaxID=2589995 RepID=A0A504J275_9FLAO|nr:hypothetical protein [Aquimarina algicola]TPN84524.1 hypothetical protein FHK87_16460 [Aquimarina algicola]